MDFQYVVKGELNAEAIIKVFADAGWDKRIDDIVDAFKHSYYILVYHNGKLVGFARAISDGYYYTWICDVVVIKDYQRQGIGRHLVNLLVNEFKNTSLYLKYAEGKKEFYKNCGFEALDSAMWIRNY